MTSRCVFGCGENGDLEHTESAKRLIHTMGVGLDRLFEPRQAPGISATRDELTNLPQRLHKVCVLLWRLPKDEVPLASWRSVAALLGLYQAFRTHSFWAR